MIHNWTWEGFLRFNTQAVAWIQPAKKNGPIKHKEYEEYVVSGLLEVSHYLLTYVKLIYYTLDL